MPIELGDKVRDTVTGFTGIAIGRAKWLYGCDRIVVFDGTRRQIGQRRMAGRRSRQQHLDCSLAIPAHMPCLQPLRKDR